MNDKTKNYIKLVLVILIFFSSSIFRLIAIYLFRINPSIPLNKVLINLIGNLITISLLVLLYRKTLIEDFKDFKKNISNYIEIGVKYWLIGLSIMMLSNLIISFLLKGNIATNEQNVRSLLEVSPIIAFILTSITAPFIEELIFRKSFFDVFKNKWLFILTSGIVFGSLHVVLSLHSPLELLFLVPYCSLGIAFSYMYYESKNIYVPITIHAFHNAVLSIMSIVSIGMIIC